MSSSAAAVAAPPPPGTGVRYRMSCAPLCPPFARHVADADDTTADSAVSASGHATGGPLLPTPPASPL
eukprot:98408-Chlamydomonas_euryale.AAC.1